MRPQVRDLPPRPDKSAFGCGRSSMAEPWAVNPLVPVRLRPVTPKRMRSSMRRELERQSTGLLPRTSQGSSPWRRTTQQPPRGGIGRRTGLRNRSPQGMSVRLGPRGPTNSPVAQRQSSALIRRRPVDRSHPGPPSRSANRDHQPPRRCAMKPINEDDVSFHDHEQAAQRLPV